MKTKLVLFIFLLQFISLTYAQQKPATDKEGMVVTAQHLATKVGVDILKKGGNAIDAAVAIGYALAVVDPCCGNIGGGGFMLIHFADGRDTFINFREKAPSKISPALFLKHTTPPPYLTVGVPGTVMGLNAALEKYGNLSLKTVIDPAIHLAKKGFVLTPGDVELLNSGVKNFKTQDNVAAIFLKNGKPYQVGDRLIQKDLANTLTRIAKEGDEVFYRGVIAEEIVTASQKNHGVLTKQDFAHYTIKEQKPLYCNYRGYHLITAPPPGGGVVLCEMLNIVEGYPLSRWGYRSLSSTDATAKAIRYAYKDRNTYLGDPDFIHIPLEYLLSKKHAAKIRSHNTTSYVVVDKSGNVVSVTYTINNYFGAKVIAGETGFFLNDELDDFTIKVNKPNTFGLIQGKPNLIAPNKRPLSSMAPTILMHSDDQFYMTVGTPGGPTIPTQLLEVIQNTIDFGMDIQQAIDAPRFHTQWKPDIVFMEPKAFSTNVLDALSKLGYHVQLGSPWGTRQWGAVTAIVKDPQTGMLIGAMDSRRSAGLALGLNTTKE